MRGFYEMARSTKDWNGLKKMCFGSEKQMEKISEETNELVRVRNRGEEARKTSELDTRRRRALDQSVEGGVPGRRVHEAVFRRQKCRRKSRIDVVRPRWRFRTSRVVWVGEYK